MKYLFLILFASTLVGCGGYNSFNSGRIKKVRVSKLKSTPKERRVLAVENHDLNVEALEIAKTSSFDGAVEESQQDAVLHLKDVAEISNDVHSVNKGVAINTVEGEELVQLRKRRVTDVKSRGKTQKLKLRLPSGDWVGTLVVVLLIILFVIGLILDPAITLIIAGSIVVAIAVMMAILLIVLISGFFDMILDF